MPKMYRSRIQRPAVNDSKRSFGRWYHTSTFSVAVAVQLPTPQVCSFQSSFLEEAKHLYAAKHPKPQAAKELSAAQVESMAAPPAQPRPSRSFHDAVSPAPARSALGRTNAKSRKHDFVLCANVAGRAGLLRFVACRAWGCHLT